MKRTLASLIGKIHSVILLVAISGWLIPYQQWLKGYLALLTLILLQWLSYNNQCVLTVLENRLKADEKNSSTNTEETFIGRTVNHLCGWQPSDNIVNLISYIAVVVFMCIAAARIHYKF